MVRMENYMSNIIDAIIIDTSALENYHFDFLGWTNRTIVSFYDLIAEKRIQLLNHFVLDNEIKKHIASSTLLERIKGFRQTLQRNKDFFSLIDISADSALEKLDKLNVEEIIIQEYLRRYEKAQTLPFTDPAEIFKSYFLSLPPFCNSKDKKSEFPDAFIISATCSYLKTNPTHNILVISNDNDWKKAFATVDRVSYCDSIDEAIKVIQSTDKIMPIIYDNMEEVLSFITCAAECECFDLPDYYVEDDIEIKSIVTDQIDNIIPLRITESSILFKCTAFLKVDGATRVIDENRSYYDREDDRYYYVAYSDISFRQAEAEVDCEVEINFSAEENDETAEVENARLIVKFNIDLTLDNAEVIETECSEDDLAVEALRDDMGL